MHLRRMACTLLWLGTGCVVPRAQYDAQVARAHALSAAAAEATARARTLEARLRAAEGRLAQEQAALARLAAERVAVQVQLRGLREGLSLSEERRRQLEEQNAQLTAREQKLQALHSEVSDGWYDAALSRARRRSQPPLPAEEGLSSPDSGTP